MVLEEITLPTENEKKYVLNLDTEDNFRKIAHHKSKIYQGYLFATKGMSLRCRKTENKKTSFCLTLKSTVSGRCVEIENSIEERDFNDLWTQCMNKLEKIRYYVYNKDDLWEVDFFKDHNRDNYFCLAEFEMDEGMLCPKIVPEFIKNELIYEVELTDCRFSSKMLADIRYAKNIYADLKNEKIQIGKHASCG